MDIDLDPETWDNKTITSGLKNYLRSACPSSGLSLAAESHHYLHNVSLTPPVLSHSAPPLTHVTVRR